MRAVDAEECIPKCMTLSIYARDEHPSIRHDKILIIAKEWRSVTMRHPFVRDNAPLDASSRRSPAPCEARTRSPVPHSSSSRAPPRSHRRSRPSSQCRWTPPAKRLGRGGDGGRRANPRRLAETPADAHHRVARRTRRHRLATLARPRDGLEAEGSANTRPARRDDDGGAPGHPFANRRLHRGLVSPVHLHVRPRRRVLTAER